MTESRPFHPILVLRLLRKTLVLYLLPLVRVLFERDWPALRTALRQDLALFALLCVLGWLVVRYGSWRVTPQGALCVRWRLLLRLERTLCPGTLAALTIERPLAFRLAGASRVVLYPAGQTRAHCVTLCLSRRDAEALANRLMPRNGAVEHAPTGGERLALAVLGANFLSTLALLALAVRESHRLPTDPTTLAFAQLNHAASLAARWLPASVAWLLVLAAAVYGVSLVRSAAQTVRYTVWHTPELIGSQGGLLRRYECRVRRSEISFADLRLSPATRLLRCSPVFLTAGCYAGELPFLLCHAGQEALLDAVLPGFRLPPRGPVDTRRRSLAFFWPAGIPLGFCLLLAGLAYFTLPALVLPLLLPAGLCLALLGAAAVGYRREGAWLRGGRLVLCRQRRFSLHCLCVFHPAAVLSTRQSPWAMAARRANLRVALPGGLRATVRSVPLADLDACLAGLEEQG